MNTTVRLYCATCESLGDCTGTLPQCANCWEVECRLATYLCSAKGRVFVAEALHRALSVAEEITR